MAVELIGVGGAGNELQLTAFDKRLLTRFRASTCYMRWGRKATVPRNGGKSIQFRKFESIYAAGNAGSAAAGSAPAALTEGTYPAEIQATVTSVAATLSQYGQYLKYSDVLEAQGLDDYVAEQTDNFSEAMADALDLLTRDVLVGGTNVQFAGTAASRGAVGSGMLLNLAELREAKRTLKNNNVPPPDGADGKYVVITNPNAMFDLEGDANITNFWQYAGVRGMDNQLFDVSFKDLPMGFRVCETTNARVFANSGLSLGAGAQPDVVATMVLGKEAYGVIQYESLPARIISHRPGTSGIADPLDQVGTLGWKASHAAIRLQEQAMVRIEHLTTSDQ